MVISSSPHGQPPSSAINKKQIRIMRSALKGCTKTYHNKEMIEDKSKEEPATNTYKVAIKLQRALLLQPGHYSRNIAQTSDDCFSINISTLGISTSSTSSTPQAKSLLEIKPESKGKSNISSVVVKTSIGCDESREKHLNEKLTKFDINVCKERFTFMIEITSKEWLLALHGDNLFINYEIVISD